MIEIIYDETIDGLFNISILSNSGRANYFKNKYIKSYPRYTELMRYYQPKNTAYGMHKKRRFSKHFILGVPKELFLDLDKYVGNLSNFSLESYLGKKIKVIRKNLPPFQGYVKEYIYIGWADKKALLIEGQDSRTMLVFNQSQIKII